VRALGGDERDADMEGQSVECSILAAAPKPTDPLMTDEPTSRRWWPTVASSVLAVFLGLVATLADGWPATFAAVVLGLGGVCWLVVVVRTAAGFYGEPWDDFDADADSERGATRRPKS
jgi:hypothetical protein